MEFTKDFFEGEVRNDFYITPMMKKAWAAELEVLGVIDRICKKYGLQYFAEWGTLLGAVRHKGFIPWDDDIDICMKRKDYDKFFEVAKAELSENYILLNMHTYPDFDQMLGRVVNSDRIRLDDVHLKKFHGCPYAVGIDIFPLDFVAPTKEEEEIQCQLISLVLSVASAMAGCQNGDALDENELSDMLMQIEQFCGIELDRNANVRNQLYKLAERLCSMYNEEEAKEITLMTDLACNLPHYRMTKECYGKAIYMPFENMMIPVPVGYETILPLKYGQNYMTPINQRANHDYPFYKPQEEYVLKNFGFVPE